MSTERNVIAASVMSRNAFVRIDKHIEVESLSAAARVVMQHIADYYDRDPHTDKCDIDILEQQIISSVTNPKHKETFEHVMKGIAKVDVSAINVATAILEAKRDALGAKLGAELASGSTSVEESMREYLDLHSDLYADEEDASELINDLDLDEMMDARGGGDLIRVYPSSLNSRIGGGMVRGEHLIFFARPEMGKTLFLVNAVGGFLSQGLKVLYIGNEEPVLNVAMRVVSRITGRTHNEIEEDRSAAIETAREKGWSNLYMKFLTPGTPSEIENLVVETECDVLIVDQLRNVDVKEENLTRSLEKAGKVIRQIAGRNSCLAISVTQAGDSASNKAVLEMNDVDSSNTGIPATCDVMVGMGAGPDDVQAMRRIMSLIKNKRAGNHEFFPVKVTPILSKMEGMG